MGWEMGLIFYLAELWNCQIQGQLWKRWKWGTQFQKLSSKYPPLRDLVPQFYILLSEKQFIKYWSPFTLCRVSIIFKWWLIKSQTKSVSDGCMKLENSCGFHFAIFHHVFGRYLHPPLRNTSEGGVSFLKWRQLIGYKVGKILTPKICCLSPSVKGGEQIARGIDAAIRTVFLGDSWEWDGTSKGSLWEAER